MPGKESTPPFQSKLTPYRNEILKAWFRRRTLREIQAMLQKHGVTISQPVVIIQCLVGGNHLFSIGKVTGLNFPLPQETVDHDAEQPFSPAAPDVQRTCSLWANSQ